MPTPSYFHWCFTINNYVEEEDVPRVTAWGEEAGKYWIIGRETGESGTPHLQGYISLRKRRTAVHVSTKLAGRAYITRAAGTARQNRRYCSKGGDFVEGGEINEGKGSKSRDAIGTAFMAAVQSGDSGVVEFANSEPGTWIFNGSNMLRNALSLYPTIDRPAINVQWIWGLPGVGKSRHAHDTLPHAFVKEPRTKWWNGYLCQKEVIIDDFGPNGIDINHLLRWFDRYKCAVETKGGMVALYAETFIVTSNFHPSSIFKFGDEVNPQLSALERRMTIIEM